MEKGGSSNPRRVSAGLGVQRRISQSWSPRFGRSRGGVREGKGSGSRLGGRVARGQGQSRKAGFSKALAGLGLDRWGGGRGSDRRGPRIVSSQPRGEGLRVAIMRPTRKGQSWKDGGDDELVPEERVGERPRAGPYPPGAAAAPCSGCCFPRRG